MIKNLEALRKGAPPKWIITAKQKDFKEMLSFEI
jgi:hypothetical protein